MSTAALSSLIKVAAVTAAGAFLGALQLTRIPTTWADARPILATAIASAVAAEIVFLRAQLSAFLRGDLTTSDPTPTRTVIVTPSPKDPSP